MKERHSNWAHATVGEVTVPYSTIDPHKFPDRHYRYIDIGSIDNTRQLITEPKSFLGKDAPSRARRVVQSGDILFSTVRTYLKNIAMVPKHLDGALTSTGIAVLRPSRAVDPDYLFRWICSDEFVAKISESQDGTMYPAVRDQDVANGRIPLPPIAEQRRIATKLNTRLQRSKTARAELDRIPRLVERYKQAVMAAAFRGELTAEWRKGKGKSRSGTELLREIIAAYPAPERERTKLLARVDLTPAADLPDIPDTWTWAPVWLLSSKVADGVHKKPVYVDEGVPFLTVKNLTVGPGISFSDCRYVTQKDHEEFIKRTNPENGDILITKDGTLGVVRAIRTDAVFSIFVSLALVKPVDRSMTDYLELAFTSPQVQQQMTGVGTGLQHIHLTDLRRDLIPIAPKAERDEIVRRVSGLFKSIDKMNGEAGRASALLNRLDQATLAKAFRGELLQEESVDAVAVW
jgi:type I restriction enzyme S subunit